MNKINQKIEKPFRFDFPMQERTVSGMQYATITHGILDVHCVGKFAPEASPLDPEARYQVDLSIVYLGCCNVTPMLDWSGRRDDVEDAARRHFAKLIELEQPAFKVQPQMLNIDLEQVASEIREYVRWFCREEYVHFVGPFNFIHGGHKTTAWAITLTASGDIMLMDGGNNWHTLQPTDKDYLQTVRDLREHMEDTCATLVKNA